MADSTSKKWGVPRPPDAPLGPQPPFDSPVDTPPEWLQWLQSRLELDLPDLVPQALLAQGGIGNVREYSAHGVELMHLVANGLFSGATSWDFKTVEGAVPGSTATDTSANAPLGAYLEVKGQNSYICLGFPLGPKGSVWKFDPIFSAGPDCGIVTVEWQTQPGQFGTNPRANWGNTPENLTSDTNWWRSAGTIGRYQVDCYNATSYVFNTDGGAAPNLFLSGNDGVMLAANPTVFEYTDTQDWDGGADGSTWWWVRMKTKTKNAASSGYALRLHGYSMHRVVGDLVTPG